MRNSGASSLPDRAFAANVLSNMAEHMRRQHPEYVADNVVKAREVCMTKEPPLRMVINSCQRKESYPDRGTALRQMVAFKRSGKYKTRRQERRGELQPYHCGICGRFHLGHKR